MKDQRKEIRLQEFNEISTTVIFSEARIPQKKMHYHYSEDISVSGTRIRGNIYLPVDTLLEINFRLKHLYQKITTVGKVKWIKKIIDDKLYEAGVEFVNTPGDVLNKIEDYMFWKQRRALQYAFYPLQPGYKNHPGS
jgi:hypothetical protein